MRTFTRPSGGAKSIVRDAHHGARAVVSSSQNDAASTIATGISSGNVAAYVCSRAAERADRLALAMRLRAERSAA